MGLIEKYRRKQFAILLLVFIVCAFVIFFVEYRKEKALLVQKINKELDGYTQFTNNFIIQQKVNIQTEPAKIDSFVQIIPDKNIRITLIDDFGIVLYDSRIKNPETMENHKYRPEIQQALHGVSGSNIRVSATTKKKYYYFARKYQTFFIRASIEYNPVTASLFEPEKISIFVILLIFFGSTVILVFVTDKFGTSLNLLKDFAEQASKNQQPEIKSFPKNELGNVGQDIVDLYDKLNKTKTELVAEKEKLIRHLNMLDEGVAIYSRDRKIIAGNSNFIQFLSHISDSKVSSAEQIFEIPTFSLLFQNIENQQNNPNFELKQTVNEITIDLDSRIFLAKSIGFPDKSIEVIIRDITKPAKRKLIKQQLTDNIAHELKTPVSSIKGYLETILDVQPDKEKLFYFIKKAYSQTCRLTNLINDISVLTKIEEAGNLYKKKPIDVSQIIKNVMDDVDIQLKENNIEVILNIPEQLIIDGNSILIYSIFRNLFDNTLTYAGKQLLVKIERYLEDNDYHYFTFSDSGIGVPEEDLQRLFERFYRVEKGREHKKGGTGLGLAIVKNAVMFHKGEISVKNRKEGGLEFLFSLKKFQ